MVSRIKLFQSVFFRSFLACCFFGSAVLPAAKSSAQSPTPAPASPAADPVQEAAKHAFEALPEADRITLQDGLIWTGDYKGVADGKFGKGTRDAIAAFATRNTLPADGTLDAKGRAALASTAKQAKEAVNFSVKADERTGLRIGLPMKLLTKAKPLPAGIRYSSADESFSVETITKAAAASQDVLTSQQAANWKNPPAVPPAVPPALQDAFNTAIADAPGRKVTYKVLRPDFFVVTGDAGVNTFYTRMTRGERAGIPTLTGFTITYPAAAKARLDPISIAIANSFVPFPDAAAAPAASAAIPSSASSSASHPSSNAATAPVAPVPMTPNSAAPNPQSVPKAVLAASGVAIAPGLILTSLPHGCTDPQAGTKKAKISKQSDADGLTLLSLADAPVHSLALQAGDPASPSQIVVLSFAPRASAGEDLIGASGDLHKQDGTGSWRLLAPVQNPVAGAVLLDRSGALTGMVPADAASGKAIAGVLPQMNRTALPASKLAAFLADARPKPADSSGLHTVGEIVSLGRAVMVPIYCMR